MLIDRLLYNDIASAQQYMGMVADPRWKMLYPKAFVDTKINASTLAYRKASISNDFGMMRSLATIQEAKEQYGNRIPADAYDAWQMILES